MFLLSVKRKRLRSEDILIKPKLTQLVTDHGDDGIYLTWFRIKEDAPCEICKEENKDTIKT